MLYTENVSGRVVALNFLSNQTDIKVTGLLCDCGIARYTNSTTTLFFVSERKHNTIQVYSKTWNGLYRIGEQGHGNGDLYQPRRMIISPASTLWVCDAGNKRVTEFTLEGVWKRHVLLAERDDIGDPLYISYHPNHTDYLWISYFDKPVYNAKRFQIY